MIAQSYFSGETMGRTILQNPFQPVHRAAVYKPDSCDCLHPEDRQDEVSVRIQNLWASFSLSQMPLKKLAHYNLLTSTKKEKSAIFLPFVGDLQQVGFRGLQLEGNVNVKSIDGPFSASCHKLKASTSGEAWRRGHREEPGGFGFAFLSGAHMLGCPGSLPPSPLPQQGVTACVCPGSLQTPTATLAMLFPRLMARPASGVTTAGETGLMAEAFSPERQ